MSYARLVLEEQSDWKEMESVSNDLVNLRVEKILNTILGSSEWNKNRKSQEGTQEMQEDNSKKSELVEDESCESNQKINGTFSSEASFDMVTQIDLISYMF